MSHIWETSGPTIDEQVEAVAAEIIWACMSNDQKFEALQVEPGFEIFAPATRVEIVREAVKKAQREGADGRYGSHAMAIFGVPK